MAMNMFLYVDGVAGDSRDERYPGWLDVLAWSGAISWFRNEDEGMEFCQFQDLCITKWVDRSSPKLYRACAHKTKFPHATLEIRYAGGDREKAYVYKFHEVTITSCSMGGSAGEDRLTENISFGFTKVEWIYHIPKNERKGEDDTTVEDFCDVPAKQYRSQRGR